MGEPFLAEIKIISWDFAPKGWAFCSGQLLPINQNQALFSLLGTTYGGDGRVTFGLPNLQGRAPIHIGNGHIQGEASGEQTHTVLQSEMPGHTHIAQGTTAAALELNPSGKTWATSSANPYSTAVNTNMAPTAISPMGSSQPHENMQPYLVLNFIIALQGIFPSRN